MSLIRYFYCIILMSNLIFIFKCYNVHLPNGWQLQPGAILVTLFVGAFVLYFSIVIIFTIPLLDSFLIHVFPERLNHVSFWNDIGTNTKFAASQCYTIASGILKMIAFYEIILLINFVAFVLWVEARNDKKRDAMNSTLLWLVRPVTLILGAVTKAYVSTPVGLALEAFSTSLNPN